MGHSARSFRSTDFSQRISTTVGRSPVCANARTRAGARKLWWEALEPRGLFSVYTVTSLTDLASLTTGTLRYAVNQANLPEFLQLQL